MALSPTMATKHNMSEFDKVIDIMKSMQVEIDNAGEEITKSMAKKFLGALIKRSPVLTGRYVKSHKVGIDQKNTDVAPFSPKLQTDRRSAAASANITGMNEIGHAKNFKKIYISNSLFYADRVEYLGWKNTPPYFVYHHATLDIIGSKDEIVKKYIKEAIRRSKKGSGK